MNLSILILCYLSVLVSGKVVSYTRPSIYSKSNDYLISVNNTRLQTISFATEYDYIQLSMDEGFDTEFRITAPNEASVTDYTVSPLNLPIKVTISGKDIVFKVSKAHYLIITINKLKKLIVMADPVETDVPASSGTGIFNVMNYGADNTGATVTKGLQSAMDAAAKTPGSIVYVPAGVYNIGNLILRGKTSLYLAPSSVVRFTGKQADYDTLFTKDSLLPGTWWIRTEVGSTNVKVYGRGTIDGQGVLSRANKFMAQLLVPIGTTTFIADGPLIRDGSFWTVTPIQSSDVALKNLKILNSFNFFEDDGIDVVESTNVRVDRVIAIAKDDSFSTKTWPIDDSITIPYPYPPRPLSNVVFNDCVAWSQAWGYKIGQGVYTDQTGVIFKDSVVYHAAVGMGIDHKYGVAKVVDTTFYNIDVESISGSAHGMEAWLVLRVEIADNRGVGPINGVKVNQIRARTTTTTGGYIQGFNSTSMVTGVTLSNIYMKTSTTPAKTLAEMNILNLGNSASIVIQ